MERDTGDLLLESNVGQRLTRCRSHASKEIEFKSFRDGEEETVPPRLVAYSARSFCCCAIE
jgi:hypothetical protein